MTERRGLVWLGVLMAISILVSGCSGVVRGAAQNSEPTEGVVAPGEPVHGLAPVDEVYVMKMESLPVRVGAIVSGNLPDGCTELGEATVTHDGDTFTVELPTVRDPEAMCTEALVPFQVAVQLEALGLKAGTYTVEVNGVTATFTLAIDNVLPEGW